MTETTTDVRYPIGKYVPQPYSEALRKEYIRDIKFLPNDVEMAIQNLDEFQLQTPYRDGGWTVAQVVHHIADSHMNAYIRFKLGLTEDSPTIKTYEEGEWAKLQDNLLPINVSITLLHALHRRLEALIESITEEQFHNQSVYHPEKKQQLSLWTLLGMYSWHGRHHVAHITTLRETKGW